MNTQFNPFSYIDQPLPIAYRVVEYYDACIDNQDEVYNRTLFTNVDRYRAVSFCKDTAKVRAGHGLGTGPGEICVVAYDVKTDTFSYDEKGNDYVDTRPGPKPKGQKEPAEPVIRRIIDKELCESLKAMGEASRTLSTFERNMGLTTHEKGGIYIDAYIDQMFNLMGQLPGVTRDQLRRQVNKHFPSQSHNETNVPVN
jgi:hypothetical protein